MLDRDLVKILKSGGVVVMPTDTIYGVVGSALKKRTVERIYRLRKRNPIKPFIILISSPRDLVRFGIRPDVRVKIFLNTIWSFGSAQDNPGPVSVVLPCPESKFRYLHRGTKTLAFRVPKPSGLRALLSHTGPLVAPSANIEGEPPAKNVGEAFRYFNTKVDVYVKGVAKRRVPSLLVEIKR